MFEVMLSSAIFRVVMMKVIVIGLWLVVAVPTLGSENLKIKKGHQIVFLISEDPDNYEAHRTIPAFANALRGKHGFEVTVLLGRGPRNAFEFPNLEILRDADLLVVFCRRVALPLHQLAIIKQYLDDGKPVIGIRTANHAFSVREEVQGGHEAWWDFVPQILGCENKGYGPVEEGTIVSITASARKHFILRGLPEQTWHSTGNLYLVSPLLDERAVVLLTGTADDKVEPIAWTRTTTTKSKVFYTSLGHPHDFENESFKRLLINGIHWALRRKQD